MKPVQYKVFDPPLYPDFARKYRVYPNGKVINQLTGEECVYPQKPNQQPFIRLFGKGKSLSMQIARLMLLTWSPSGYKPGLIALHKDGNPLNNVLTNLRWGTRADQAAIAMQNPEKYQKIQEMGQKSGPITGPLNIKKAQAARRKLNTSQNE
jgi:hypothetical protein